LDGNVWLKKADMLEYLKGLKQTKWVKELIKEIEECYYVE
jgi:hypothetical protein